MRIIFRPLTEWPGELRAPWERDSGNRFRAGWNSTVDLLTRETEMIGGDEFVVQLAISDADLRRDGMPRAHTQPRHPGVTVVVPSSDHGRLSWSTDRYADWRHNVRAIALSMEALRAADRHGVMAGRQYAGFAELGPGESEGDLTVEDAARFLIKHGEWGGEPGDPSDLIANPSIARAYYREAAKRIHPDAGGDPERFRRLQVAKDVLEDAAW